MAGGMPEEKVTPDRRGAPAQCVGATPPRPEISPRRSCARRYHCRVYARVAPWAVQITYSPACASASMRGLRYFPQLDCLFLPRARAGSVRGDHRRVYAALILALCAGFSLGRADCLSLPRASFRGTGGQPACSMDRTCCGWGGAVEGVRTTWSSQRNPSSSSFKETWRS